MILNKILKTLQQISKTFSFSNVLNKLLVKNTIKQRQISVSIFAKQKHNVKKLFYNWVESCAA